MCRLVPEAHIPKIVFVVFVAPPTGCLNSSPCATCHWCVWNSVGVCKVPGRTKKPLGPMPQNPQEVGYFHFKFSLLSAIFWSFWLFGLVFEVSPPREFAGSASKLVSTVKKWCWMNAVLCATVRRRACPWRAVKVGHFDFVVFFSVFCERITPRTFIRSASKLVSKVKTWCWMNAVHFATVRRRACLWRIFKVGHFLLRGTFFRCLWTNYSKGICRFCFKIGQHSQKVVLNERRAFCDRTSKGVSVASCQSWPFWIECNCDVIFGISGLLF